MTTQRIIAQLTFFKVTFFIYLFSLLISISAMDFFLLFPVIAWLTSLFRQEATILNSHLKKIIFVAALLFMTVLIGLYLRTQNHSEWITEWRYLLDFKWLITLPSLIYMFKTYPPQINWLRPLSWFFLFLVLICFFQIFAEIDIAQFGGPPEHKNYEIYRVAGLFGHPISFAHAFSFFVCLSFGIFLFNFELIKKQPLFIFALLLSIIALVLTFTRGVWISVFIAFSFMVYIKSKRAFFIFLSIAITLIALVTMNSSEFRRRLFSLTDQNYYSNFERVDLWRANFEMFKDHPLLGVGFKNNVTNLEPYFDRIQVSSGFKSHSHNQWIQFLSTTGLLGFTLYITIMILIFREAIWFFKNVPLNNSFQKGLAVGLLGAFISFWIGGFSQNNFDDAKVRHIFIVFVATLYAFSSSLRLLSSKAQD